MVKSSELSPNVNSLDIAMKNRGEQLALFSAIISTTEDPEGFPHSGASSSTKQTAASRVPTMLGSFGNRFWKQWRDHESVDSRNGIQENVSNLDRESVVSTIFRSQSNEKRDRDQNVVHSLREREREREKISTISLNGKFTRPSEEREWLSKNCVKLRQKLRREIVRREILTSLLTRSI